MTWDKCDNGVGVRIAALAAEEMGVLSVDELRAAGLTRTGINTRVKMGLLHRIHQGVYAVGHPELSMGAQFRAAVKACRPAGALSESAAAAHWDLLDWDDGRAIDVTVPGTAPRSHSGLRVHRTRLWTPADHRHDNGIHVTSPARTILDLAGKVGDRSLRRLIRGGLGAGTVSMRELVAMLGRLRSRKGARRVAELLATGPAPTKSELEDIVLDLVLAAGFELPDVNQPIMVRGRKLYPDLRWPDQRLIIEADSRTWHSGPIAVGEDAERQALLEVHGERVLRVTYDQCTRRVSETIDRIDRAGAPRPRPGHPTVVALVP